MNTRTGVVIDTGLRSGPENIRLDRAQWRAAQETDTPVCQVRFHRYCPTVALGAFETAGHAVRAEYCITGSNCYELQQEDLAYAGKFQARLDLGVLRKVMRRVPPVVEKNRLALADCALENSERRRAESCAENVAEMCLPVVVKRIEQILDVHAGFRVAFNAEPAAEEKRIRVLTPGGELPVILQFAADTHVGAARRGRPQTPLLDAEMEFARRVPDVDAYGFAVDFRQARRQRLTAQQVVEYPREQFRVHGVGDETQRQKQWLGWHVGREMVNGGFITGVDATRY